MGGDRAVTVTESPIGIEPMVDAEEEKIGHDRPTKPTAKRDDGKIRTKNPDDNSSSSKKNVRFKEGTSKDSRKKKNSGGTAADGAQVKYVKKVQGKTQNEETKGSSTATQRTNDANEQRAQRV
jgi:hypothetical protein